ncbi:hypothetical protein [uncultured Psychrobacter sp.]|uniref:hypothetical protein n=1 Tax=uncultured Psychrobacter sp. TaxID=259303 RepID=UPI0034590CCF
METKDPALTKTPISDDESRKDVVDTKTTNDIGNKETTKPLAEHEKSASVSDTTTEDAAMLRTSDDDFHESREEIEENTTVQKGTDTFEEDVVESEHVYDGDNPARQPDRRDQEGSSPFDENVNEETMGSEEQQSDEITDRNRYATVNNAQTRTLTPDEED